VSALGGRLLEWLPGHDEAPRIGDKLQRLGWLRCRPLSPHAPSDQLGGDSYSVRSGGPPGCRLPGVEVRMIHSGTRRSSWVHSRAGGFALCPLGRLAIAGPLGPHQRAGGRGCCVAPASPLFQLGYEELPWLREAALRKLCSWLRKLDYEPGRCSARLKRLRRESHSFSGNRHCASIPPNERDPVTTASGLQRQSSLDRARPSSRPLQAMNPADLVYSNHLL